MTTVAHELKASYAFIERNFFLTRRYWGWELAFLVYSVAGALSVSLAWYVWRRRDSPGGTAGPAPSTARW